MRFAVAHKVTSYLMVGFAYFALIAGGGVPPLISFGGLVALVASWWWEPPLIRFDRWTVLWTIGSILALGYSVMTAVVSADFLGVGAEFLVWLIVAKAFNRRAARDWQQMYLLAFLMLVAGSVLNPDLTYGLCFLGFVIASTWALTLFHLRREMEDNLLVKHAADRASERVEVRRILDSRRIVNGRFFLGTGALSFGVFVGAALVFLALPRVGIGFFVKGRGGLSLVGFTDGVKLGGHGVLKNDATVVMRVEIASRYGGREAPGIHWRGVAFDHYERGQWSRQSTAPRTLQTLEESPARDRRFLLWDGPAQPSGEIDRLASLLVKQSIWLDPLDSDVLFGASAPRIVEYAHTLRPRRPVVEHNDEVRLDHGATVHYTVWSELLPPPPPRVIDPRGLASEPGPEALRAVGGNLPEGYEAYLQLPKEITKRTRDLARQITSGLAAEYDKAEAIKAWLFKNLSYTLVLAEPGAQEPVDFFLFDRKKGHCEYFASAFAVLARAVAIPTRQVNGFLGGEWNEYQGYVAVRAGDAHSWDEVYFPGAGWVTFDPTPPGNIDELGRGGTGFPARLGRFLDTLRFQWNKWVIEYDLASQLALFKTVGGALESAATAVKRGALGAKNAMRDHWPVPVAVITLLALGITLRRRRRRGGLTPGPRPRPRVRSPIAQIYDEVARVLAKSGVPREAAVTPRELALRMAARGDTAAPQVGELTELYYAAEWGRRRDSAAEQRARALADEIRATRNAVRRASR